MKKNLFVLLSFVSLVLVWCWNINNQVNKIDSEKWFLENWISIDESFNKEIEWAQYIKDFDNFVSYDIFLITENKPFVLQSSFKAKFDKDSYIQWWIDFSQKKISKTNNLELSDIEFDVDAMEKENNLKPFDLSWSLSLLYKDDELYAKIHKFWVFMWEWNMVAKMYSLLWDLIVENWVDLEVHSWWVITVDNETNKKLPYIIWTIKNVLKTEDIGSSPNFLWSVAEIIDIMNWYINLWISTDELNLMDYEISYYELSDKTIQKSFTWSFQWKYSKFDLSFLVSKKWLEVQLYNIKDYDENTSNFKDTNSEILFSIEEVKKPEYSVNVLFLKDKKQVLYLEWKIKYWNSVQLLVDFVFEPLEMFNWNKISWNLDWIIIKESWDWNENIPELTGNILSLSDLLSSL